MGFTYASSYARHLVAANMRTNRNGSLRRVRMLEMLVVTHAIRTPSQVRQGWRADDLRLYLATSLGEFHPDGSLTGNAESTGHVKPPILQVAERMFHDGTGPHADIAGPDLPEPLRTLLQQYPELRDPFDARPMQARIGTAVISRDVPDPAATP
jgi:hypothetical protein